MTKGIVIKNSKDVRIESCSFENLDTAIEAEGVVNLQLKDNKVVETRVKITPELSRFVRNVLNTDISDIAKRELINNVVGMVVAAQEKRLSKEVERRGLGKVRAVLGKGAWELVGAILSKAIAGKVLVWMDKTLK